MESDYGVCPRLPHGMQIGGHQSVGKLQTYATIYPPHRKTVWKNQKKHEAAD